MQTFLRYKNQIPSHNAMQLELLLSMLNPKACSSPNPTKDKHLALKFCVLPNLIT